MISITNSITKNTLDSYIPIVIENAAQMPRFSLMSCSTDYGRPIKAFFIEIQNCWVGGTNWADEFWGIWGIVGQIISSHFGTVSPLSKFSVIHPLFLQKN